jgi:hypothetical protein
LFSITSLSLRRLAAIAVLAVSPFGASTAGAADPFRLSLPLDCRPGVDCVVQNYFDHDPGPDRRDHMCGHMTYDGHDGIDFRLVSMEAMRNGVMVRAAAPGRVTAVRDEVPDDGVTRGREAIAGKECGNAVVVAHTDGWKTQYCHMAEGSITVGPGAEVKRGEVLGRVGLSGRTEFPHLHLTVRRNDVAVDPFAPDRPLEACGAGPTLWTPEVEKQLAYVSPFVLEVGFIGENLDAAHIDDLGLPPLEGHADQPARVAVTRTIGIERGDVLSLDLYDPSGKLVARNAPPAFDRPKAQWLLKAGLRRAVGGWMSGPWHAVHRVSRAGVVVAEKTFSVDMPVH